jgi:lactoylglutathione lyase
MKATFVYAIKFVADMDRAVAFYRDTFQLTLRFATPFWSEFETGAVTLALHPASERNPAGATQLGFASPELEAVYAARGGRPHLHPAANRRTRNPAGAHPR